MDVVDYLLLSMELTITAIVSGIFNASFSKRTPYKLKNDHLNTNRLQYFLFLVFHYSVLDFS